MNEELETIDTEQEDQEIDFLNGIAPACNLGEECESCQ